MEEIMSPKLWSDEERLFIPRAGGWPINFKHIARTLGWVKKLASLKRVEVANHSAEASETSEDRLRRSVESSRFEGV
jgi:hypothetical protein